MADIILGIGDKNLSSWSLRPWFLMTGAGVPFTEENIRLDRPESKSVLKEKSPSGLVPYLTHGDVKIWDSLAIMEYLNDIFPEKTLWPKDIKARALARAVSAEMHSGFSALRGMWPMMVTRKDIRHTTQAGVARDIERIDYLWSLCRKNYGAGGDFLFGKFSIADAMYAPVVTRFVTYGPVDLSPDAARYREMIMATPAMKKWIEGAKAELAAE
jgi:glutathione S-transferase